MSVVVIAGGTSRVVISPFLLAQIGLSSFLWARVSGQSAIAKTVAEKISLAVMMRISSSLPQRRPI